MSLLSGGCQCGAVRYACTEVSHISICHCRMCQKAFGNVFAPLGRAANLVFTRGTPKRFRSSNKVLRGFCADCGTPMTYEFENGPAEIAICTLDDPTLAPPKLQVGVEAKLAFTDMLIALPQRSAEEIAKLTPYFSGIESCQHPDHDTVEWPVATGGESRKI